MQVPQPNEGDSGKPIKLLDRVRNRMRVLHLSKRTEETYVSWISRYVYFHRERRGEWVHPENLIGEDVTHFLTYLAVDRRVAASTQNQAFSSLLFLYTKVLGRELKVWLAQSAMHLSALIYAHVSTLGPSRVRSRLDSLLTDAD